MIVIRHPPGEPTETDYTAVGCAITTISSNLTEMSKGVKLLAALMDDEVGSGHNLMGAARTLAGAVSDLLRSVEPAAAEVRDTGTEFSPMYIPGSSDKDTDNLDLDIFFKHKQITNALKMLYYKCV